MKAKMAAEQVAYGLAKAIRDIMLKDVQGKAAQIPHDDPEWAEKVDAIYDKAGYYEHLDTYHAAEAVLFDWAHERMRALPQYAAHRADLERLFATRLPHIREKLIDTCMRLQA